MDKNNYLRIGFAGTSDISRSVLQHLIEHDYKIELVLTKPDSVNGRGHKLQPSAVKLLAIEHKISILQPVSFLKEADSITKIESYNLDLMIVISYGLILPQRLLNSPKFGCVNIHVSLLPKFRGAAPIQRAILSGEEKSGITLIKMDAGLDTGDILLQREINIEEDYTSADLERKLTILGNEMIIDYLNSYNTIIPEPQPLHGISYAHKIDKQEATINWHDSAKLITRKIKAFNPSPGCKTTLDNNSIKIWNAILIDNKCNDECGVIIDVSSRGILVSCGGGTILAITEIQEAGKNRLNHDKYILGHSNLKYKRFV